MRLYEAMTTGWQHRWPSLVALLGLSLCLTEAGLSQTGPAGVYPYPTPADRRWTPPATNVQSPFGQVAYPQAVTAPQVNSPLPASGFNPPATGFPGSPSQLYGAPTSNSNPGGQGLFTEQLPGQAGFPAPAGQAYPPVYQDPLVPGALPVDIDVYVPQGPTGRFMLGGTYGSDNGVVGELIIDERDFDISRFPRSFSDFRNPGLWKGGGQTLRVELVPGSDVERYVINFAEPFLFNSETSLSLSGYYYERDYAEWDERRAGGRIGIGRRLTNYLSLNAGLRLEEVTVFNPVGNTSPQLNANLGSSDLFLFNVGLVYDSRQSPYNLDSGSYFAMSYHQAFGDFSYGRGEIDFRTHRVLFQRSPTSGQHRVRFRTKMGFSGSSTPVFENYFAGGMTSLRGFDFRGVGPLDGGIRVGGEFQWLNSLEYEFPITRDDMISGVAFVDFGTVEESVELNSENFRTAPGVGLRVKLPYLGMSAPLAFDFAFPVSDATGDIEQNFSFLIGAIR